ncbi:penicillin acylase family protein [Haloarchaeobius sp. HRN-SO-5]|uniref:penicillin acylase family protein n=1 Tax=Haloarchaeobius sp. HRN-SO-5 TaxID=3446118 RepID=UPI003EB73C7B
MPFDTTTRRDFLRASAGAAAAAQFTTVTLAYQEHSGQQVRVVIRRDEYGVPHVFAPDASGPEAVFFGYGYASAADRLFQLELSRRFYHGTVADVLGPDWVDFDRAARVNRSLQPSVSEQLETRLDDEHRSVLQGYTEGVNRYIETVETSDEQFHKGFVDNDFTPDRWTAEEVAGIFVAVMEFFSNFQLETLGAAVFGSLESEYSTEQARELFADVQWGNDPGAPTSGAAASGYTPPYTPSGPGSDEEETASADVADGDAVAPEPIGTHRIPSDPEGVHEAEMERQRILAKGLDALGLPIKLGSNALAVNGENTESGDAILFGGPQMGFSSPSVMYEVGLHGPDIDVTGSTVAGFPFVMFGHNQHGAFTSTAGLDNAVQTFVESIDTGGEQPTYTFRGEELPVERRTESIPVAGGDDASVTIRRTRHGVVTSWTPEENEALAIDRGYEGRGLDSLRAFYDVQFASTVSEFAADASQCTHPINFMWADEAGDIGFFHLGRYPDPEQVDWDLRLPADGTRHDLTPGDYRSAADGDTPFVVNPDRGFTANWNNKPAPGWNNGDLSYAWGTDHRVQRIINLVTNRIDSEGAVSYEFMKDIVRDIAFVDLRAIRYKGALVDALSNADLNETEQQAFEALRSWDDYRQADGEDFLGTYPVGYTVFDAFFPHLLRRTFEPTFGSAFQFSRGVFFNYRYGRPLLMRALHPDEAALEPAVDYFDGEPETVMVAAFRDAVADLESEFGSDVGSWRADAIVDRLDNMALFGMPIGVGDAGNMPFLNRGTENHFVRLDTDEASQTFTAENVLPPGNSAYVAPDGTQDEHYADQLEEFLDFEYKTLLFTRSQVSKNQESTRSVHSDYDGRGA